MKRLSHLLIIFPVYAACQNQPELSHLTTEHINSAENPFPTIGDIPVPQGYERMFVIGNSFAEWLRKLQLKKDKTVYKYDGLPKKNQDAQFAVINMSTGRKDLQQCADAIMRLRAEYFFQFKQFEQIN